MGQLTETPAGGASAQPVTLPVKLAKGAKLHALVKFSPAAPGTADGTVAFTTSTGRVRRVPVTGTGARPGLYAVPGALAFPFAPTRDSPTSRWGSPWGSWWTSSTAAAPPTG